MVSKNTLLLNNENNEENIYFKYLKCCPGCFECIFKNKIFGEGIYLCCCFTIIFE